VAGNSLARSVACPVSVERGAGQARPQARRIYGYGNRFGLIYVDFKTQQRKPKLSAEWFREASRRNAVV